MELQFFFDAFGNISSSDYLSDYLSERSNYSENAMVFAEGSGRGIIFPLELLEQKQVNWQREGF